MSKNLRHIAIVATGTLGSRLGGLLRDILIFAYLGTSLYNSAFLMAFTIPNLFRRLLGEGALTSAFIPIASDELRKGGRERVWIFLNRVLTRLLIVLLGITALGMALAWSLPFWPNLPERWYLVGELSLFLFPYLILVCLAAIIGAALNLFDRFAVVAISPVLLNLAMIAAVLGGGVLFAGDFKILVLCLCLGVLIGGLAQLLLPFWSLRCEGWKPQLRLSRDPALDRLMSLLIPGLAGAAVIQANLLVVRLLAYAVDESGVALLYLASRLIEFPLGVFSLAVITVAFPGLARMVSAGDVAGYASGFRDGVRLLLAISLPAAVGLFLLAAPIIDTLFRYGAFLSGDVARATPLLMIYAAALPLYSVATLLVRALHAQKDMKSPLRVALVVLLLNLGVGITLMQVLGIAGLALANVIAALCQTLLLIRALGRHTGGLELRKLAPDCGRILLGCAALAVFCLLGLWVIEASWLSGRSASLATVFVLIPAAAALYFVTLSISGFRELSRLKTIWFRRSNSIPNPLD